MRPAWIAIALLAGLAGCKAPHPAPAQDRAVPARPMPKARAEDTRPDQYVVKAGDTLHGIALEFGLDYRDIARFNGIENPDLLLVGQVLRLRPPKVAAEPRHEARAAESKSPDAAPAEADEPAWQWPTRGRIVANFGGGAGNKGIDIAGLAGQPVQAAASGRVVYAGSGLRGYGKLVIIKHNAAYLTAYAHNRELLVKEGQTVARGQKISEMGESDAADVRLHFEIRRFGSPVDPAKYLPLI